MPEYWHQEPKGVRSQGGMPPCTITFPVTIVRKGMDPNRSEGWTPRLPNGRRIKDAGSEGECGPPGHI